MKIPIMDLKAQYAPLKKRIEEAFGDIALRQAFILGSELKECEKRIAAYCGARYGIGMNSGTDALIIGLDALGISAGDEVITTAFTFFATAEAISRVGAKPVFVDIDPSTYNIDPSLIEKAVTKKTKAVIPVHLYGLMADMGPIMDIAGRHGLKVIEDTAQAIGSAYKGKKAGSIGNVGALSFYPGKNLGCFGDGGMAVTNDKDLADRMRLLRDHGSEKRYIHKVVGYNSRLDNLQAAMLNVKLDYLEGWLEGRIENAKYYNDNLKGLALVPPAMPAGNRHTFHHYVLRCKDAAKLGEHLNSCGIEARVYYPIPLHLQECYKGLGYKKGSLPETEKLSVESLAIPVYPELTGEQKTYIVEKIKGFFES